MPQSTRLPLWFRILMAVETVLFPVSWIVLLGSVALIRMAALGGVFSVWWAIAVVVAAAANILLCLAMSDMEKKWELEQWRARRAHRLQAA